MPRAIGFASHAKLLEHFQDHGADFNATDEWDYLQKAIAFLEAPLGANGTLECIRQHRHQDIVRFNPLTDEFAVLHPDGTIRTYYKLMPAHLALPGTPQYKLHNFPTNLDYFQEACRQ